MKTFSMVLPPGWRRIDLVENPAGHAQRFKAETLARIAPAQRGLAERQFGPEWLDSLQQLADGGAVCLITSLDAGVLSGMPTLVVSDFPAQEGVSPVDSLIDIAATDATAALFDVDDLVAIRIHEDADRTQSTMASLTVDGGGAVADVRVLQRTHRYLLGDPGDRGRWVLITATTTSFLADADDTAVDYFTDLLDDVVSSFRWTE